MVLSGGTLKQVVTGEAPMVTGLSEDYVQINSVDLPLTGTITKVSAAALPSKGETVADLIKHFGSFHFQLRDGSVLNRGSCYIIPLAGKLSLPDEFLAVFSPKSSTGREDVLVRVLCDGYSGYDQTPRGYKGPLYLEVTPLSFDVKVSPGLTLTQMRIRQKFEPLSQSDIAILHSKYGVVRNADGLTKAPDELDLSDDSLYFHVDLQRKIVGFEARENPRYMVDLSARDLNWKHFWRTITEEDCLDGELVLSPNRFYLLATSERMIIPPEVCGELMVYDLGSGDFRSHYAGFFDSGFGWQAGGTHGVLEVRVRDVPFRIKHDQRICKMVFERPSDELSVLYGTNGSNYTAACPCIAKHYTGFKTVWEK